ncbi:MAG: ABC transporter permease [Solirubrobacteraceae bacterium]
MSTLSQTLTTLRGRPGRTFLTALGTALGIATIVALLAVVGGVKHSAGNLVNLGPSELGLFQADAADPTTSILSTTLIPELDRTPGIAAATPLILLVGDLPKAPGAIVFGADRDGFLTGGLVFSSGRPYRSDQEIDVGDTLAQQLHLVLGQTLTIDHRALRVVGIYHNGIAYQDAGAFVPLATAQAISDRPGETTSIVVKLSSATRPTAAKRAIAERFPGIEIISDAQQATRAGVSGQLIDQFGLVIVVLALVLGGIVVANTMLMAVIERRSEFAVLSAVGFSGPQIAGRVLVESILTTILGAAIGLLLGIIGAHLLVDALGAQTFVSPQVTAWDLGRGLLVGVLLGVLGGLYPAWRAAHVSPARVLAQH